MIDLFSIAPGPIAAGEPEVICPALYRVLNSARTAAELMQRTKAHVRTCPTCNPLAIPERMAA